MNIEEKALSIYPNASFRHPQHGLNRCPTAADWDACAWDAGASGGAKPTIAELTAAPESDATIAEALRLAKRPKRSEINALTAKVGNDNSVAELRATVALLVGMMDDVLAFQQVDVDEDE